MNNRPRDVHLLNSGASTGHGTKQHTLCTVVVNNCLWVIIFRRCVETVADFFHTKHWVPSLSEALQGYF
uniref:Uncharacterized protein n=1 Tax=Romanomermis culicivorax TaxID=13658 RepID=A0A915IJ95_ROMCU